MSSAISAAELETRLPVRGSARARADPFRSAWKLWRTRFGALFISLVVLVAVFGPFAAPFGAGTFIGQPNRGPGGRAVLGTDFLGQDVLSRFLLGGRSILTLSVLATALAVALGVAAGLVAAYARSAIDDILMRTLDMFMAIPQLIFALVALAILGARAWLIVLIVGLIDSSARGTRDSRRGGSSRRARVH